LGNRSLKIVRISTWRIPTAKKRVMAPKTIHIAFMCPTTHAANRLRAFPFFFSISLSTHRLRIIGRSVVSSRPDSLVRTPDAEMLTASCFCRYSKRLRLHPRSPRCARQSRIAGARRTVDPVLCLTVGRRTVRHEFRKGKRLVCRRLGEPFVLMISWLQSVHGICAPSLVSPDVCSGTTLLCSMYRPESVQRAALAVGLPAESCSQGNHASLAKPTGQAGLAQRPRRRNGHRISPLGALRSGRRVRSHRFGTRRREGRSFCARGQPFRTMTAGFLKGSGGGNPQMIAMLSVRLLTRRQANPSDPDGCLRRFGSRPGRKAGSPSPAANVQSGRRKSHVVISRNH
jgi:hypothetical protein